MASSTDKIQLTPETVFISPGGSVTITATCDNTSFIGQLTWTRFVNDNFSKLDTGSSKYDECFCQGLSNTGRLTINQIEPSDKGKYRVEVRQVHQQRNYVESNVVSLYVLEDVNAVCKEELNLLRYKECESMAKGALRFIFDRLIPPNCLASHLSKYKDGLRNSWKCRNDQLQELFPKNGLVSSKNFDISLLYKLLRNTTTVKAPVNGWNVEPNLENTGEGDDIERIHQHRNFLCHLKVNQLSEEEFESRWFDLTTAIDRLSKGTLRRNICFLRNKKFEQMEKVTNRKYSKSGIMR
ncbi:uncharacterized protein LOC134261795, partial [Saccostrea cucullata]|uniref:uncharacterized protein LOC134261795 n=1 Tax=Saccostrea cuccullata TaxID=36930 RepID=UPI002ED6379A